MTTYNTGNPLGSAAAKDLYDNAQNLDSAVNGSEKTWIDRLGRSRRSMAGIDYDANQAMLKYGYITKKSFELGATLDTPNTVLQWESNGEYYRWDGDWTEPKVVPAGSTPESAGGIGTDKWLSVGDATLRSNLLSEDETLGDAIIAVKKSFPGAIGRTQHQFNNQFPSVEDAGAIGDGAANDTSAFLVFESVFSNYDIDLHGKSFVVDSIPTENRYFNGKFIVAGVNYNANYVLTRNVNGIIILGGAAKSLPPNYQMSANLFSYTNASIAMGDGTLAKATAFSQTTAIGAGAMGNTLQSFENTAIGEVALQNVNSDYPYYNTESLNGTRNVAMGGNAGQFLVSGYSNVFIGRNCGTGLTASQQVTAVGAGALFGINVNGWYEYVENFAPNNNANTSIVAYGAYAGNLYQGINLTAIGLYAGRYLRTGVANTLIGISAGRDLEADLGVYGYAKTDLPGDTTQSNYLKTGSNIVVTCPGHGAVVGGYANVLWRDDGGPAYAGHGHAWPQKVTAVSGDTFTVQCPYSGDGSGTCRVYWTTTASAGAGASSFTLIGNAAGQALRSGNNAIAIGASALIAATSANSCVVVGKDALRTTLTSSTTVAVGTQALQYNPTANSCTALGHSAGQLMQSGAQPTGTLQNSTMIGSNSRVSGDNQVQLGDSATTTYVYGTVQNRSDERDKADIQDIPKDVAVEFVRGLSSKFYRWDMRDDYVETYEVQVGIDENALPVFETRVRNLEKDGSKKRVRLHAGWLAQDIKALLDKLGIDCGLYQDHLIEGGCDVKTLGYDESIPFISLATAVAHEKIEIQDSIIAEQAEKISSLEQRLKVLEEKLLTL
ncbi:tail fiber domain-containing protein [Erwiniaceae bacterium L1_54_3]|nr:tail fiber domain-containing protein [Erwiniaceae bacterium L1_54_3]